MNERLFRTIIIAVAIGFAVYFSVIAVGFAAYLLLRMQQTGRKRA